MREIVANKGEVGDERLEVRERVEREGGRCKGKERREKSYRIRRI